MGQSKTHTWIKECIRTKHLQPLDMELAACSDTCSCCSSVLKLATCPYAFQWHCCIADHFLDCCIEPAETLTAKELCAQRKQQCCWQYEQKREKVESHEEMLTQSTFKCWGKENSMHRACSRNFKDVKEHQLTTLETNIVPQDVCTANGSSSHCWC